MKTILSILLFIFPFLSHAQEIEMAEHMRSEGKIYVVIAVLLSILIGLILFLVSIDRKVSRLEKEVQEK